MLKVCPVFLMVMMCAAPGRAGSPAVKEPGPADSATAEPAPRLTGEDIFAGEFVLDRSTDSLYAVFESTTPEHAAAAYLRRGIYRREFLVLFVLARESGATFKKLVLEREKGVTLQTLAARNKLDLMKIFRDAAALQDGIESRTAAAETAAMLSAPETSSRTVRGAGTDADVKLSTSSKN